jgi:hypothetical protein
MYLIAQEFIYDELDAIGLQELNAYKNEIGIKTFKKEFKKEFEKKFKKKSTNVKYFAESVERDFAESVERDVPNYDHELNIKGIEKYCIISFGVDIGRGVPTVALIYNTEKFGTPSKIFCEDCEVAGQNGRPMLGVITSMDFGLISMHAPNVNQYLQLNKNPELRKLIDNDSKMQAYFRGYARKETVLEELSKIDTLINTQFMTPMVDKITNFIRKLKINTNKIVLMGDMNDAYPRNEGSLSNQLRENSGLQFFPGNPTCCYNWDSSKTDDGTPEYTKWIFGRGHPDDTINKEVIQFMEGDVEEVKEQKSHKKNYVFTGDLIYFTDEFKLVGTGQEELFPQNNKKISQYSDHVFQKITLSSTSKPFNTATARVPDTLGGKSRRHTKKRKSKKVKKSIKRRRSTKRRRPTKRRR